MANSEAGWTGEFTVIGYYWLRERGEAIEDASVIEYQGGERAYIVGADDNFYKEWTSGRYEFLGPLSPSDAEQLIELRKAAIAALPSVQQYALILEHPDNRAHFQQIADNLYAALNPKQPEKEGQSNDY